MNENITGKVVVITGARSGLRDPSFFANPHKFGGHSHVDHRLGDGGYVINPTYTPLPKFRW